MALIRRKPKRGTIPHSDQSVQYTSSAYQQQLREADLVASMGCKGMSYDNAIMKSFFSSLKQELSQHERFEDREQARARIFDYIEVFYNRQHLHSGLFLLTRRL